MIRLSSRREPTAIASLRPRSRALVRGRVVPRDLIESPLAGQPCVWYRFAIDEVRPPSPLDLQVRWQRIAFDEAITEFWVDDGTGRVLVVPVDARVDVPEAAVHAESLSTGRRGAEVTIGAEDEVEVGGVAEEVADLLDDARGYRDSPARLALRAPERGVLIIRLV